ncbi:MAG: phosphomannomutase [Streblomastix strix]|uniref:Phosphomannomutase n=1 Tax=Streblomastix strix TaxID=222440 RepID=A0A5J4VKS3_9EUKA|nr:MAG: phosphomannomutase [Streblomastix strix]
MDQKRVLVLFDVDGTLSESRKTATPEMASFLRTLATVVDVGYIGGSDYKKQVEQLHEDLLSEATFSFSENGLVAFHNQVLINKMSIKVQIGETRLRQFIDDTLLILSKTDYPIKRGTFIEFRNGMLNISPIGRNCTQEERDEFFAYDKIHQVRQKMIDQLEPKYKDIFTFSIGGQISFDVFPHGWDKSYALQFCTGYEQIHFFGDMTEKGGNDYEIFIDPRVIGHSVKNPADTIEQCTKLFIKQ